MSEESLKLLPVALLVVLAPRRARRFGACDWLLLGWASGSAFTAVEEGLRRAGFLLGGSRYGSLFADPRDGLPRSFVRFDTSVLPGLFDNGDFAYAGHGVVTAVVCATLGLALTWTRLSGPIRHSWLFAGRGLGLLAAVAVLFVMVADHAAFNASVSPSSFGWLDPDTSTVPAVVRRTAVMFGTGHGRGPLLLTLLAAGLLVDAARLGRTPLQGDLHALASPGADGGCGGCNLGARVGQVADAAIRCAGRCRGSRPHRRAGPADADRRRSEGAARAPRSCARPGTRRRQPAAAVP